MAGREIHQQLSTRFALTPVREDPRGSAPAGLIRGEMWRKARGHGIDRPDFEQPERPMSAIGG